jgi:uncharacterized protein
MELLGFLASVLIGISLGMIGGGGSILTMPVLVYLFHLDVVTATIYSLFLVGTASVFGSFSYFKQGLINLKVAAVFGIPSVLSVIITRKYIVPEIPNEIGHFGAFTLTRNVFLLLIFAFLMIYASYKMIKKCTEEDCQPLENPPGNKIKIIFQGILVGGITGLIGAGGGFLIMPALVNILRLEFKKATGTSLFIIAINSLIGFLASVHSEPIDWLFLFKLLLLSIIGVIIGGYFSKRIDSMKLKPAFGWFILVMGIYILIKELFL